MKYFVATILLIISFLTVAADADSLRNAYFHAPDKKDRLYAGVIIARQIMRNDMDSAFMLLEKAAPLANDDNVARRSEYFNTQGMYFWYSRKWDKAIDCFKKILKLDLTEAPDYMKPMAASNIGSLYNMSDQPDSARKYINIALQADTERDNIHGIMHAKYSLGVLHRRQNQYELALNYLFDVADFQRSEKDTFRLIHTMTVLGNIYSDIDSIDKALDYYIKCAEKAVAINDKMLIVNSYNNISFIYCSDPVDLEKTLYYAKKGLSIAEENKDYNHLLLLNTNIGMAYLNTGKNDKAIEWMVKAYKYIDKSTDKSDITRFYLRFGKAHKVSGNYDKARKFLSKGLQMAESAQSLSNQSYAYFQLASVDSLQGNTEDYIRNYIKGTEIRDNIWSKEHRSRISELQIIYETEKKEFEIAKLRREQQVSRLLWQRSILIAIVSTILFLSIIIILYTQRKIAKQQLIIRQQEIDKIKNALKANKQELTGKALSLSKSEQVMSKLKKEIQQILPKTDHNTSHNLKHLLKIVKSNDKNRELWKDFETRFDELNDGFITKLVTICPDLTPTEIRLCAMLRLQMSTKEISEVTNRSPRTIETIRSNIRKKMGLGKYYNLTNYILKV